jgi:hypothetical protein
VERPAGSRRQHLPVLPDHRAPRSTGRASPTRRSTPCSTGPAR